MSKEDNYYTREQLEEAIDSDIYSEYAKKVFKKELESDLNVFPHLGSNRAHQFPPTYEIPD